MGKLKILLNLKIKIFVKILYYQARNMATSTTITIIKNTQIGVYRYLGYTEIFLDIIYIH